MAADQISAMRRRRSAKLHRDKAMREIKMARVREASVQDAMALPDVERSAGEAFRDVPDLAWIAEDEVQSVEAHLTYASAGSSWVIVDDDDQPYGFLSAERCDSELHVWELAVRAERQGQGGGRALMEAACAYARHFGLTAVTLTTFRGVPWNEPFYARLGFTTLNRESTSARLSKILESEMENGLPGDRRCAMRLDLSA